MERRRLGQAGPEVSVLGLGTMTFGDETDEREARAQLDRYVEAGGTLIDTADVYGDGASETIIGRWLRERPADDELVITTKGRFGRAAEVRGASRRSIEAAVQGSLRRLQRDHLDVYMIHGWDPDVPVEETLAVLADLCDRGLVGHTGWSNVTGWQLQRIISTARAQGWSVPVVLQPQYNLLERGAEHDLVPVCIEEGLAVTPWSPLGGGWLTGKYDRARRPTGATRLGEDPERGVEAYDRRNTDRTWRIVDEVTSVADEHGVTPAEVAVAWLLRRPTVASVLLGARTEQQLRTNLAAADVTLSDDAVLRLTAVSDPGLPSYPHGLVRDACGVSVWTDLGVGAPRG